MKMELEDYVESSGSDRSGSVGTDNGSASGTDGSGSANGIGGSSGNTDGNSNGTDGNGSGNGNDSGSDTGNNGSAEPSEPIKPNDASVTGTSGNKNTASNRRNRGHGKPIRLGSFGDRNTDTTSADTSGSGTTERDRGDDSEPVIRLGSRASSKPKDDVKSERAETTFKLGETKELISVFLNSVFEIPAITLKQDFWRLSKDEGKMLTDAISQYLQSMPKSKASKVALFIQENLPLVNLCMIGFFILSERVRASIAIAQVTKAGKAFEQQANAAQNITPNAPIVTPLDSVFNN